MVKGPALSPSREGPGHLSPALPLFPPPRSLHWLVPSSLPFYLTALDLYNVINTGHSSDTIPKPSPKPASTPLLCLFTEHAPL